MGLRSHGQHGVREVFCLFLGKIYSSMFLNCKLPGIILGRGQEGRGRDRSRQGATGEKAKGVGTHVTLGLSDLGLTLSTNPRSPQRKDPDTLIPLFPGLTASSGT